MRAAILYIPLMIATACAPKPAQIAYLSPLDRQQEGFLDSITYQVVSYGRALDFSKPLDAKKLFFPRSITETFDNEEFIRYNIAQQALITARKPPTGFAFTEVMEAEANQLNPQDLNLALLDEKIRGPMEVNRVLFDNACSAARVAGLYRWLIADALQMKLLHGATLPREGLANTSLDSKFFPPREYYVAESEWILKNLDQAMQKKKYRFEIVHETFSKPEQLECKIVIHVHRRNLQTNMPFLAPF